MGIHAIKPRFRASLHGVEARLVDIGVSADQLTAAGLASAVGAAASVLLSAVDPRWMLAVAPLVLGRLACNALDGMVAADTGTARPLGLVFNEFGDRVADSVVLFAVALRCDSLVLGAGTVVLVLLSSYLGMVPAAAGGRRQYNGFMGKADRMVLLAALSPAALVAGPAAIMTAYLCVVGPGAVVTIIQRAVSIRHELGP
jgi:CDP-diacylglycerol--glycerol-3-phosphate 3-phosphatidyltransferase